MRSLLILSLVLSFPARAAGDNYTDLVDAMYERAKISFLFTNERRGRVAPFECLGGAPVAGVAREWEVTAKAQTRKGTVIPLTLGPVFTPLYFEKKDTAGTRANAVALTKALRALGTRVAMPTGEDLLLEPALLKELESSGGFSLVNSSLVDAKTGRLVFPSAVEVPTHGMPVLVVGIEAADAAVPPEYRVLSPEVAMERALKALPRSPGSPRVVVVLSHLGDSAQRRLLANFAEINLFFGGIADSGWAGLVQLGPGALQATARSQGRAVTELTLGAPAGSPLRFFSPEASPRGTSSAPPADTLDRTQARYHTYFIDDKVRISRDNPLVAIEATCPASEVPSCRLGN